MTGGQPAGEAAAKRIREDVELPGTKKSRRASSGAKQSAIDEAEGIQIPTAQDIVAYLEKPPVRQLPVEVLAFDKSGQSGQIRDVNMARVKLMYRDLQQRPAPVRPYRCTVVNDGRMPLPPCFRYVPASVGSGLLVSSQGKGSDPAGNGSK